MVKILRRPSLYKFEIFFLIFALAGIFFAFSFLFTAEYSIKFSNKLNSDKSFSPKASFPVSHIVTPSTVKGIYISSWAAGTPSIRGKLVSLLEETELNTVVIDIKDYSGKISFKVDDAYLNSFAATENRISDIKEFINELHSKGIYVIGRISVFQDVHLASRRPDLAVKTFSNKNKIWKDRKGLIWLDPGAKEVWEYVSKLGEYSYSIGFDELNFDYIRFPSDGDVEDIYYPFSQDKDKTEVITSFFAYIYKKFRDHPAVISADVFGMTTTVDSDLKIGQKFQKAAAYFDFVCPMVYPSHYPPNFLKFKNPAAHPYEVVKFSIEEGLKRGGTIEKMRPWLQDFDLGADYNAQMLRAQIQAVYDSGVRSWLVWSPSNEYSKDAFSVISH
jgi:hypothetical protein